MHHFVICIVCLLCQSPEFSGRQIFLAYHLRKSLLLPLTFCHGFLNIFWRWYGIRCPSVMVKFINLFIGMDQLVPSLFCSCCNFSLARRISTVNRLVITFLKLGHSMDSALRSSSLKLLISSRINWISVSMSESLLCWSAIFVGVDIIIVFDQLVSSFPSLSRLFGFFWNWLLIPYTHRSPL